MPAKSHSVFHPPTDKEIAIWRYLDLSKFVSVLATSSLFFSRADHLGDPFEGSFSKPSAAGRAAFIAKWANEAGNAVGDIESESQRMATIISGTQQGQPKCTYVNCWHMNNYESAAMWRLYGSSNEAIAVKSSYSRLAECLDEKCYVGQVSYLDYDADEMSHGNALVPFVCKRKSFEHERELRAVTTINPDKGSLSPLGIQKAVDLHKLVDKIYVSPHSAGWFKDVVVSLTQKYGLEKEVLQSGMLADPIY